MTKISETVRNYLGVWMLLLLIVLVGSDPSSLDDDTVMRWESEGMVFLKVFLYSLIIFVVSCIVTYLLRKFSK